MTSSLWSGRAGRTTGLYLQCTVLQDRRWTAGSGCLTTMKMATWYCQCCATSPLWKRRGWSRRSLRKRGRGRMRAAPTSPNENASDCDHPCGWLKDDFLLNREIFIPVASNHSGAEMWPLRSSHQILSAPQLRTWLTLYRLKCLFSWIINNKKEIQPENGPLLGAAAWFAAVLWLILSFCIPRQDNWEITDTSLDRYVSREGFFTCGNPFCLKGAGDWTETQHFLTFNAEKQHFQTASPCLTQNTNNVFFFVC